MTTTVFHGPVAVRVVHLMTLIDFFSQWWLPCRRVSNDLKLLPLLRFIESSNTVSDTKYLRSNTYFSRELRMDALRWRRRLWPLPNFDLESLVILDDPIRQNSECWINSWVLTVVLKMVCILQMRFLSTALFTSLPTVFVIGTTHVVRKNTSWTILSTLILVS